MTNETIPAKPDSLRFVGTHMHLPLELRAENPLLQLPFIVPSGISLPELVARQDLSSLQVRNSPGHICCLVAEEVNADVFQRLQDLQPPLGIFFLTVYVPKPLYNQLGCNRQLAFYPPDDSSRKVKPLHVMTEQHLLEEIGLFKLQNGISKCKWLHASVTDWGDPDRPLLSF